MKETIVVNGLPLMEELMKAGTLSTECMSGELGPEVCSSSTKMRVIDGPFAETKEFVAGSRCPSQVSKQPI